MRNSEEKQTMNKTRKAFDWVLSCLIRFPIILLFFIMALFIISVLVFIFSPETFEKACEIVGVVL